MLCAFAVKANHIKSNPGIIILIFMTSVLSISRIVYSEAYVLAECGRSYKFQRV